MADLENKDKKVEDAKVKAKSAPKKDKVKLTERIKKFFRDYKSEIRKIVWCSPQQTVRLTGLVLVCIVVIGAVIGGLDFVFNQAILGLGKLI